MTKLALLKKQALIACINRGHTMGMWMDFDKHSASTTCVHCLKSVCVDVTPLANGIDIAGEAVALNCED